MRIATPDPVQDSAVEVRHVGRAEAGPLPVRADTRDARRTTLVVTMIATVIFALAGSTESAPARNVSRI